MDVPHCVSLPITSLDDPPKPTQRFVVPPYVYVWKPKVISQTHRFADPPITYVRKRKELPFTTTADQLPTDVVSGTTLLSTDNFALNIATTAIPSTYKEAMSHPAWYQVCKMNFQHCTTIKHGH